MAKELTQERHNKIVDRVSEKYARAQGISNNGLRDLVDDLKAHWQKIVTAWKED